jgi:hypothetical protein
MTFDLVYYNNIYTITLASSGEIVEILARHEPNEVPLNIDLDDMPKGLQHKIDLYLERLNKR